MNPTLLIVTPHHPMQLRLDIFLSAYFLLVTVFSFYFYQVIQLEVRIDCFLPA